MLKVALKLWQATVLMPAFREEKASDLPVRIGVSSCLLGREVRYDGGHKKNPFLVHELGRHVEWVPVCPEFEVGMGVPREPVRLIRGLSRSRKDGLRMVGVESGKDWTDKMERFSRERARSLEKLELSGFVLKSKSPSCGIEGVKVYSDEGRHLKNGRGLFATALMKRFPLLPIEDEGRLEDSDLRESFLERVFCHHRWLLFRRKRFSLRGLEEFHRRHMHLLLARSPARLRALGRMVAAARRKAGPEVAERYARAFFEALKLKPTVRRPLSGRLEAHHVKEEYLFRHTVAVKD